LLLIQRDDFFFKGHAGGSHHLNQGVMLEGQGQSNHIVDELVPQRRVVFDDVFLALKDGFKELDEKWLLVSAY